MPPPLYHAVGVDLSGHRHDLGSGPLAALRETTMATWLAEPRLRSAYVLDPRGNAFLSLEPRDRSRLMHANPARRSKNDGRRIQKAVTDWFETPINDRGTPYCSYPADFSPAEAGEFVDLVQQDRYVPLDEQKAKLRAIIARRVRRNPDTLVDVDAGWREFARFDTGWRAFNEMIALQARALSNTMGRVETVPSRSRPGKISYAVSLKFVEGPKQSLDFLESQYVIDDKAYRDMGKIASRHGVQGNKHTSRRLKKSRRRTSRRAA